MPVACIAFKLLPLKVSGELYVAPLLILKVNP